MKPFKPANGDHTAADFDGLPWLPPDVQASLGAVVSLIVESFPGYVSRIGLYGSWQRGKARPESDVDIAVFLAQDVSWFDAERGIVDQSAARKDKQQWHAVEKKVNRECEDSRAYSVAFVAPAMMAYYAARGPIHLQNWVEALRTCHILWRSHA